MRRVGLENVTRGSMLGDRIAVADGRWTRLRGLIGRPELRRGEGLLLVPSRSVHMYWMKQALDVAFLNRDGRVVAAYPGLAPGRTTRWHSDAACAVELPPGTLAATGTQPGDEIHQVLPGTRPAEPVATTGVGE